MTKKDGTKWFFGYQATEHAANTCGRIQAAGEPSKIQIWSLSKVMDIHGNYYTIEYNEDTVGGDYYPVRITYTKNEKKPLLSVRTVQFTYETRTDHWVMYDPTKVDMDHRLKWITVKVGNNLLRKWRLDYEYGTGTSRSHLTGIQEYGCDGNYPNQNNWEVERGYAATGKTLPVINFTWQNDVSGQFTKPSNFNITGCLNYYNGTEFSFIGDFNGDGKSDVLHGDDYPQYNYLLLSNGDGSFTQTSNFNITGYLGHSNGTQFSFIGDFNGDGKSDVLHGENGCKNCLYLSNGDGSFTQASNFNITGYLGHSNGTQFSFIGDFNGDGKSDILHGGNDTSFNCLYLSNGDGSFTKASNFNITGYLGHSNGTQFSFIGDFNGDGKSDVLHGGNDASEFNCLYLSNGDGSFTKASKFNISDRFANNHGTQYSFIGDFNGDGKSDILYGDDKRNNCLYISNGDGSFTKSGNFNVWDHLGYSGNSEQRYCCLLGDYNGDGKTDIMLGFGSVYNEISNYLYISNGDGSFTRSGYFNVDGFLCYPDGSFFSFRGDFDGDGKTDILRAYNKASGNCLFLSNSIGPDLLIGVVDNQKRTMSITYAHAPQVSGAVQPDGKTYPNIANSSPTPLVTKIQWNDGITDNMMCRSYDYNNGMVRTGFPDEQANLGYESITWNNGGTATYVRTSYHQDDLDLRLMVDTELVGDFVFWDSNPSRKKTYTMKQYTYTKSSNDNNPDIKIINVSDEYVDVYNDTKFKPIQYRMQYGYDPYGNVILQKDYGDINVTGDEQRTETQYNYYITGSDYLMLPKVEQKIGIELDGTEGLAAETRYFYNNDYTLEHQEQENGDKDVTTKFAYDEYGNVISTTDGNNNTTKFIYDDDFKTFLRYKTLKFTEETVYDELMRPVRKVDANGQTWETTYDVFSREKSQISPGDTAIAPTTRVTYPDEFTGADGNPTFPLCKETEKKIANGNYLEVYTYYDALRRVTQEKTEAKDGWITVDHLYDDAGLETKTSMPYYTTTSAYGLWDDNTQWTTKNYDALQRMIQVQKPDTTETQYVYSEYDVFTVDELGHVTNKRIEGNKEYDIKYTGIYPDQVECSKATKLTACDGVKTTDAVGKEFTTKLDMLGRTISSTTPVNGTWVWGYDANNNVISQTDAKNQKIFMQYDALNRITQKTYPDGSSVNYCYDEKDHGFANGLLTRVVYPGGAESYTYDARGRKTGITQTIDGISRTKSLAYNAMDQVVTETYPDGEVVTNAYDIGGQLTGVAGAASYVTGINYYATNKISQMKYGNGVQTDYDYYDTTGETDASAGTDLSFRLKQIRVSKGTDLLNLNYEYDKAANVKVKNDTVNNKYSETYGYDELNRLTSANSTSYGSKTFQYDIINNITQKDNRNYQYDTTNPYKLVNDGKYGYTYDANGSMIGRSDGRVIGWDVENRVGSVSDGGSTENCAYDYQFRRIKQGKGNETTFYFFDDYEEVLASGAKTKAVKYYFANQQRVAENSSTTGVRHYHQDHLSSSTAITDVNGTMVLRNNYAPYGEDAASTGNATVRYKFTDKEKDQTGLYYFGARYYDPEMGRFISIDPIMAGDNWYAYCYGNPVKYTDPQGMDVGYNGDPDREELNSYNVSDVSSFNDGSSVSFTWEEPDNSRTKYSVNVLDEGFVFTESDQHRENGWFGTSRWVTDETTVNRFNENGNKSFTVNLSASGDIKTKFYTNNLHQDKFFVSKNSASMLNNGIKFGVGALIGELTTKIKPWISGGFGGFIPGVPEIKSGYYTRTVIDGFEIVTGPRGSALNGIGPLYYYNDTPEIRNSPYVQGMIKNHP